MKIFLFIVLAFLPALVYAQDEPFVYDDHGRRDPFWKLVGPSGNIINYDKDLLISDVVLEGIIVDNRGNNLAIINSRIIKKDDRIGLFVVKEIGAKHVTLIKGEKEYVLELKKEE